MGDDPLRAANSLEDLEKDVRDLRARFEELIESHRRGLWRYCLRLTGSPWDAEDLVQETLTRAFSHLARLGQALNARAYLFRTASNAWIQAWRRRGPIAQDIETAVDLASQPIQSEETRSAMEMLARTPELIQYAAEQLGVAAEAHGYRYKEPQKVEGGAE